MSRTYFYNTNGVAIVLGSSLVEERSVTQKKLAPKPSPQPHSHARPVLQCQRQVRERWHRRAHDIGGFPPDVLLYRGVVYQLAVHREPTLGDLWLYPISPHAVPANAGVVLRNVLAGFHGQKHLQGWREGDGHTLEGWVNRPWRCSDKVSDIYLALNPNPNRLGNFLKFSQE